MFYSRLVGIVLASILLMSCAWLDSFASSEDTTAFSCPITPPEPDHPAAQMSVAPSGSFPVWISTRGSTSTSRLLISPPPYPGYYTKALIWIDKSVHGDVTLTAQTLGDTGVILFSGTISGTVNENGDSVETYVEPPSETHYIEDAHEAINFPNPPGLAHRGFGWYVSGPGCYQITATMIADDGTEYITEVVFEVTDD